MLCSKLEDVVPNTAAPTTLGFVLVFQIVKTVWLPLHLNITKMKKKKDPSWSWESVERSGWLRIL